MPTNMPFSPFRLVIKTVTPVILTEFAPSLDGVIYAAVEQMLPNKQIEERLEFMKSILEFNDDLNVFHASALRLVVTPDAGILAKECYRADVIRNKLSSDLFKPNGQAGKYKNILTAGGPMKTRMSMRYSYDSPMYVFEGVGDANKIKRLLLNAFVGIGYDCFNIGCGEIKEIDIIELNTDVSIHIDGKAKRNLPADFCSKQGITGRQAVSPLMPPYYIRSNAVDVLSPVRIDAIPSTQLFEIN